MGKSKGVNNSTRETTKPMTPEEIVNGIWNEAITNFRSNSHETHTTKAIEAINQYAREMCDKQKQECLESYCKDINGQLTPNKAITHAPYPKELL